MAKRPSFQFYPADWRNNANLRRCSHAARGAWIDILSILHDSDEYGVCRWNLSELSNAAGVPNRLIKELVEKQVLKGSDTGIDAFIFRPRHAGKDGEPVTLIEETKAPCWYCSRFVRDEYIRSQRGKGTRFGDTKIDPDPPPTQRIGEDLGDGPSSTSTSTVLEEEKKESADAQILEQGDGEQELELPVTLSPGRPNWAPSWELVKSWFASMNAAPLARRFFEHHEARHWMANKAPILHFPGEAYGWIQNSKGKGKAPKKDPQIPDALKHPPDPKNYYSDDEYQYAVRHRNTQLQKLGIHLTT